MGGKLSKSRKKRRPKHLFSRILQTPAWLLLCLAVLFGFLTATVLRFNHITMNNLKAEVLAADKEGNEELLKSKLQDLRSYTTTHIIFNLVDHNGAQEIVFGTGTFYLEGSYQRTAQTAIQQAQELANQAGTDTNPNGNIYQQVSAICDTESRRYGWGWTQPYFDCWTTELAKYPTTDSLSPVATAQLPDASLYHHAYASPLWYPCLSGFLFLACLICTVWALIRIIILIFSFFALKIVDKIEK